MKMRVSPSECRVTSDKMSFLTASDKAKIRYIIGVRLRKNTKGKFLGFAWLFLDPLIISLIYFFVFTVVKSNPNAQSILVGVTLYRIFQSSIMGGVNTLGDLNGGINSERVRSEVIMTAEILYRIIDSTIHAFLIVLILVIGFNAPIVGAIGMLIIAQLSGVLFFGVGASIAPLVSKIPDLKNLLSYILRLGFYTSPAMYPMSRMVGLHYKINEFNPFAYQAEFVRGLLNLDSMFYALDRYVLTLILLLVFVLTLYGIRKYDQLRWRMTAWP